MLSMITRKSPFFESHDLIHPTVGLKRVDNDLALVRSTSLYSGLGAMRFALPKLQNIMKPRSCVLLLFFSFSSKFSMRIASSYNAWSFVCSYKYNNEPG